MNQREIKFRAWDKKKKRFIYIKLDNFNGKAGIEITPYSLKEIPNEVIYQQFTGLHDKNGKEIYEGDILRFKGLKPLIIQWQDDENKDYNYGWNFGRNDGEVIGNIYENPELLK